MIPHFQSPMTARAFQTGMKLPELLPGKLRIYSVRFCPYAQRVLLLLAAKNIDHEVVNIHLDKRPEWASEVLPNRSVPVLHQDGKVISGSMAIAEYLEEVYESSKLLPSDPYLRALDRSFLDLSLPALEQVLQFYFKKGVDADSHWSAFLEKAPVFEKELVKRGTPYFSGDKPGYVDFVNWPTFSFAQALSTVCKIEMPSQEEYPRLYRWRESMAQDPIVTSVLSEKIVLEFMTCAMLGKRNFDAGL